MAPLYCCRQLGIAKCRPWLSKIRSQWDSTANWWQPSSRIPPHLNATLYSALKMQVWTTTERLFELRVEQRWSVSNRSLYTRIQYQYVKGVYNVLTANNCTALVMLSGTDAKCLRLQTAKQSHFFLVQVKLLQSPARPRSACMSNFITAQRCIIDIGVA